MKLRKHKEYDYYVLTLGKETISFNVEYWEASEPRVEIRLTKNRLTELKKLINKELKRDDK